MELQKKRGGGQAWTDKRFFFFFSNGSKCNVSTIMTRNLKFRLAEKISMTIRPKETHESFIWIQKHSCAFFFFLFYALILKIKIWLKEFIFRKVLQLFQRNKSRLERIKVHATFLNTPHSLRKIKFHSSSLIRTPQVNSVILKLHGKSLTFVRFLKHYCKTLFANIKKFYKLKKLMIFLFVTFIREGRQKCKDSYLARFKSFFLLAARLYYTRQPTKKKKKNFAYSSDVHELKDLNVVSLIIRILLPQKR